MENIKTIAQLWPLCLIAFLVLAIILFRKELKSMMIRFSKIQFKRGSTELNLEQEVKTTVIEGMSSEKAVSPEFAEKEKGQKESEVLKSENLVTAEEWFFKMLIAHGKRNLKDIEEAFEKCQKSETDGIQKLKRKAFYLWMRYDCGDTNALEELKKMSSQDDIEADARHTAKIFVGQCYVLASNFEMGLKAYEDAANISITESEKASDINEVADCLFKLNKKDEALQRIMDEIGETKDLHALPILYTGLARIYELAEDYEFRALALEKVLEITPNDKNALFSAGYSYGQGDTKKIALLHYKTLLEFEPEHGMALNNIGVEYQVLHMPINSIIYFKKSADKNETLAMANLAYQFLNTGFKEEASEILEKAKKQEEVHKNVIKASSALDEKVEQEKTTEKSTLVEARDQQRFFLQFAGAYFNKKSGCPQFDGTWKTHDGIEMVISKKDNVLEAYWERNKDKYKITGEINNSGAKVTIFKYQYVLSKRDYDYDKDNTGYSYITADGQQLNIMIVSDSTHSKMSLTRIK
jgi:tetratricopeptide (TPR) repeat protein